MKKKVILVICCFVVILIAATCAGLYENANARHRSEQLYEETWNIDLPDDMEKEFEAETPQSFQGDGLKYTVYAVPDAGDSFSDFESEKDSTVQDAFSEYFETFHIDVASEHLPNWSHDYTYKHLTENENHLYMVYDPETQELFILQVNI